MITGQPRQTHQHRDDGCDEGGPATGVPHRAQRAALQNEDEHDDAHSCAEELLRSVDRVCDVLVG
jgi:hypothetical protein